MPLYHTINGAINNIPVSSTSFERSELACGPSKCFIHHIKAWKIPTVTKTGYSIWLYRDSKKWKFRVLNFLFHVCFKCWPWQWGRIELIRKPSAFKNGKVMSFYEKLYSLKIFLKFFKCNHCGFISIVRIINLLRTSLLCPLKESNFM